jgi:hypothetical protein
MSAGLWNIDAPRTIRSEPVSAAASPNTRRSDAWNPAKYVEQQIRGLVQQVFLGNGSPPVAQVVFSSVDRETELDGIVKSVAGCLAELSASEVAVLQHEDLAIEPGDFGRERKGVSGSLRPLARQVQRHVWVLPANGSGTLSTPAYLNAIRQQFEYSIVLAESCAQSNQATNLAQLADGLILVLSARHTRRAAARRIKQLLDEARVRLLGTVLTDREFPIPEPIYRRL